MSLLRLEDIGKIYVSEGSVAVGIRGVNLEFDKGEFVAVTGASGSGKSTLLNVISGIDTYEEGELYIEGNPTSHYTQSDWELYRQQYISFIFQDYNIIDSFTVLENVELSLMHIEDRKARRARALELIERVGLGKFLRQKGSKLSGGQKQRTVIARALAKDSPIILADEPTGNLDSASSKEIVELLREVSKDKLLIMVTHNYEQVENIATRHIRVYDGTIEADQCLTEPLPVTEEPAAPQANQKPNYLREGLTLGWTVFKSKPGLSVFLCLFLTLGALGIFAVTSLCNFSSLYAKNYMFDAYPGRVIVTPTEKRNLPQDELESIAKSVNAVFSIHYDYPLDRGDDTSSLAVYDTNALSGEDSHKDIEYYGFIYSFDEKVGTPDIGRYPKEDDEVLLFLPIAYQVIFGKEELAITSLAVGNASNAEKNPAKLTVTGIKYFYDNTKTGRMIFTKSGLASFCEKAGKQNSTYTQGSLFFASDREAKNAIPSLREMGYIAVMSNETYSPEALEIVLDALGAFGLAVLWVLTVLFLAFFISLCTGRSVQSFRSDMAILRSMGISVKSIRISVYARMLFALIPAFVILAAAAVLIFRSPVSNAWFTYLPPVDYVIIALGMILMTALITRKQLKKVFDTSVKKNLQGGDAQ